MTLCCVGQADRARATAAAHAASSERRNSSSLVSTARAGAGSGSMIRIRWQVNPIDEEVVGDHHRKRLSSHKSQSESSGFVAATSLHTTFDRSGSGEDGNGEGWESKNSANAVGGVGGEGGVEGGRATSAVEVLPKKGLLSKKGGSGAKGGKSRMFGLHRRNWKSRFFVVDCAGYLLYYRSSEAEETGVAPIARLRLTDAIVEIAEARDALKRPFAFRVVFPGDGASMNMYGSSSPGGSGGSGRSVASSSASGDDGKDGADGNHNVRFTPSTDKSDGRRSDTFLERRGDRETEKHSAKSVLMCAENAPERIAWVQAIEAGIAASGFVRPSGSPARSSDPILKASSVSGETYEAPPQTGADRDLCRLMGLLPQNDTDRPMASAAAAGGGVDNGITLSLA